MVTETTFPVVLRLEKVTWASWSSELASSARSLSRSFCKVAVSTS